MGVIEEVKSALADEVRRNIELRKQVAFEKERADALNVAYDMLRDDVVFTLEKQNECYTILLRQALRAYAWHTESCVFHDCTCGFEEWRAAARRALDMKNKEELPFSEPPHD